MRIEERPGRHGVPACQPPACLSPCLPLPACLPLLKLHATHVTESETGVASAMEESPGEEEAGLLRMS